MTMCVFRRQTGVFRFSGLPSKHIAFRWHLLKSTSKTFFRFFALFHLQFVAVKIRLELKTIVPKSTCSTRKTNRWITHTNTEVNVDNTTETPPNHVLSANGSFYSTGGLRWPFFSFCTYWTRRRIGRFFISSPVYNWFVKSRIPGADSDDNRLLAVRAAAPSHCDDLNTRTARARCARDFNTGKPSKHDGRRD